MDTNLLTSASTELNWIIALRELKALSQKCSEEVYRNNIPQSLLEDVAEVFERILLQLGGGATLSAGETDLLYQCIAECFRIFRNCCAGKPENQDFIAAKTAVLDSTSIALKSFLEIPVSNLSENVQMCIQTSVQFLGNFIVNNRPNQKLIWDKYSQIIEELIKFKMTDSIKIPNYSAMILHNILLGCPEIIPELSSNFHVSLLDLAIQGSEFAFCAIQVLLENESYIVNVYKSIENEHRLYLLDTVHSVILSRTEGASLPISSITFLTGHFKSCSDGILKAVGQCVDQLEPVEVAKLLEVVASASGNSPYLQELQNDVSLLVNCAYLLQTIQSVGKASENNFTSIQRLADLALCGENSDLQEHPAFNFKCGIIRVLGNMCWKHRINQDKVRELDCIPLILDCCNMDARNPLIIQWVVMAIRNICEGNVENQSIIAAMTRRGTVSSATLQEMGLTLSDDGENKICISSLKRE